MDARSYPILKMSGGSMLLLPNGEPANNMDRVMVLGIWAKHLQLSLQACMGHPTFPVNKHLAHALARNWSSYAAETEKIYARVKDHTLSEAVRQQIIDANVAIDYGHPQGDLSARTQMANAMAKWYEAPVSADDILFTTGGSGGLYCIFEYLRNQNPSGKILTPFPYYPLYNSRNNLFPIHVMDNPGYALTADSVRKSIEKARIQEKSDGQSISAFIFCYPNNPLGTIITKDVWIDIANELKKVPDALIILDEAYAEMDFSGENVSLFSVAPDLRSRVIVMRSATKALSAAGERMAILICQNKALMARLLEVNIDIGGHSARQNQQAFAEALDNFDDNEQQALINFYKPQVNYVQERIHVMKANLRDRSYKTQGTFYALIDLSDMLGEPMPVEAKKAFSNNPEVIETDEHIVYSLMFNEKIAVAPLSYFGLNNTGLIRITCSLGERDLCKILDRIEACLTRARKRKAASLSNRIIKTYKTQHSHSSSISSLI